MTEQQSEEAKLDAPPPCPKCQGDMWDNRVGKRNPKAPDFKCKDRSCDGVIWPSRDAVAAALANAGTQAPASTASGSGPAAPGMPSCPVCGGAMWDDRLSKRNPRAPDFKCRNKPKERGGSGCEGVIWPPRDGSLSPYPASAPRGSGGNGRLSAPPFDEAPPPDEPPPFDDGPPHDDDDLPF